MFSGSPRKIRAVIQNARAFQKIREEFGSFSIYLWRYSDNKAILYHKQAAGIINDHDKNCPRYQEFISQYPTIEKCRYLENKISYYG